MPEGIAQVSLSAEMRSLLKENPPPENLLPINAVFPELYYRDGQTGRATVNLNMSYEKDAFMPNPLMVIIRTPHQEIFTQGVRLSHYHSDKYPGRNMMQAEVTLSEMEFAQIENNPEAEIVFSGGSMESTFLMYI